MAQGMAAIFMVRSVDIAGVFSAGVPLSRAAIRLTLDLHLQVLATAVADPAAVVSTDVNLQQRQQKTCSIRLRQTAAAIALPPRANFILHGDLAGRLQQY